MIKSATSTPGFVHHDKRPGDKPASSSHVATRELSRSTSELPHSGALHELAHLGEARPRRGTEPSRANGAQKTTHPTAPERAGLLGGSPGSVSTPSPGEAADTFSHVITFDDTDVEALVRAVVDHKRDTFNCDENDVGGRARATDQILAAASRCAGNLLADPAARERFTRAVRETSPAPAAVRARLAIDPAVVDEVLAGLGERAAHLHRATVAQQARIISSRFLQQHQAAFARYGLRQADFEPAYSDAMKRSAVILAANGIDTPDKAEAFLAQVETHDRRLAAVCGSLGESGYALAMGAFSYVIAPKIAAGLMAARGPLGGSFALGAAAGAIVAPLDGVVSAAVGRVQEKRTYAGTGNYNNEAAKAMNDSFTTALLKKAGISGLATFLKNGLLRMVAPSIVYQSMEHGVSRSLRDNVDFVGDAGGAFVSGALNKLAQRMTLDTSESLRVKLLSQHNLQEIIDKTREPMSVASATAAVKEVIKDFGKGAGTALISPSTYTTGLFITGVVSVLVGINAGVIPQGIFTAVKAAPGVMDAFTSTSEAGMDMAGTTMAALGAAPIPIEVGEHALKAFVSSSLMGLMAFGATGIGNLSGRHLDSRAVPFLLGAFQRCADRLRGTATPEVQPETVEATVRRRHFARPDIQTSAV